MIAYLSRAWTSSSVRRTSRSVGRHRPGPIRRPPGFSPPPPPPAASLPRGRTRARPSPYRVNSGIAADDGLEPHEPAARGGPQDDVAGSRRVVDRAGGGRRGEGRRGRRRRGRRGRRGRRRRRPTTDAAAARRRRTRRRRGRTPTSEGGDAGEVRHDASDAGLARPVPVPQSSAWPVTCTDPSARRGSSTPSARPIGRYGGALAAVRPDDLAAVVIRAARRADRHRPRARSRT